MNTEHHIDTEHHIVSYRTFIVIWIALLFLTGVTVAASKVDLGYMNVVVALAIATFKSSLVVAIFMHMKYENWFFKLCLIISLLLLSIFIGFTFFDVAFR